MLHEYGSASYCRFVADAIEPDHITAQLDIEPTETREGEGDRPAVWLLSSALSNAAAAEDHLIHLLDQLEPYAGIVRRIIAVGAVLEFNVGFIFAGPVLAVDLTTRSLARMALLGANLRLETYAHGAWLDDDAGGACRA